MCSREHPELLVEQQKCQMSHLVGKPTMWFPHRSDTNRPEQSQKRARSLKFRSYCTIRVAKTKALISFAVTHLRLCFRLCRLLVFPWGGSNDWSCSRLKCCSQWAVCLYCVGMGICHQLDGPVPAGDRNRNPIDSE